jgi:hypothetical protein
MKPGAGVAAAAWATPGFHDRKAATAEATATRLIRRAVTGLDIFDIFILPPFSDGRHRPK